MNICIKTLGCKSNRYESDRLFDALRLDYNVFEGNDAVSADVLIVNTCTVTHVADRKSRQAIRSYKKANPGCKVVVFGCGANVSGDEYSAIKEVDFVVGSVEEVLEVISDFSEECANPEKNFSTSGGQRTRALVKIQDGCNNYCSYCIIPRARGPEYSFPCERILSEVREKEAAGYREIVLTGINIGEWCGVGQDGREMDLADLFEMLIDSTSIVRFRVSSIEPKNFSKKLFDLFATGRLCTHMHMSLQSGCDSVLERMRRNYKTSEFFNICERFFEAADDIAMTTDVIVGFPGETEEEFEKTCEFVQNVGFMKVHVFPYSKRANTVAALMDEQIDEGGKKARSEKLRGIADGLANDFKKRWIGREYEVLIESVGEDNICRGYTPNYVFVEFDGGEDAADLMNEFVNVQLDEVMSDGKVLGTKKASTVM